MKYKIGTEINVKDMNPDIVYVQKFDDYFMCKAVTQKKKCFATLVVVIPKVKKQIVSQEEILQRGIDSVKNSIITSNKVGYRRFLRLLDTYPQKLPDITKNEQEEIKVIRL